jgi:hypothetical protein
MIRGRPDVEAIVTEALKHSAGPSRDAYLEVACGEDASLRRRVDDLIHTHARASTVLGPSVAPEPTIADEPSIRGGDATLGFEPTELGGVADHATFPSAHAALAGVADQPNSGVSAAQAASEVDTAITSLRRAIAMGYRSPNAFRTDDALDPLRNRPEFRLLAMDLAFPAEPFAGADPQQPDHPVRSAR